MNIIEHNKIRYSKEFVPDKFSLLRIKKSLELIGKNKKVLDYGCYDGYVLQMLQDSNNKVIGVDNSPSAIKKCKDKGYNVFLLDGEKLAFQNETFDSIFAGEVIEHIFDTKSFLLELNRVLKKGGELVITTPNLLSIGSRIKMLFGGYPWMMECKVDKDTSGHIRYFTSKTLSSLLTECNFKIELKTCEALTLSHKIVFTNNIITSIFHYFGRILIFKCKKIN